MTEAKHTPGPWFVGAFEKDGNGFTMTATIGPFDVSHKPSKIHYEDTICEVWDGEHDGAANARLIAAAPDLYEALRVIAIEYRESRNAFGAGDCESLRNARAALAKVTPQAAATEEAP